MPSVSAGFAPNLEKYLKSLKGQSLELTIESLVSLLKRGQIAGAEDCAIATAHCLLQVVARSKWQDVDTLVDNVRRTGNRLGRTRPDELVISNVACRVLGLIRDEALEDRNEPSSETPSETPVTPTETATTRSGFPVPARTLSNLLAASPGLDADGHLASPMGTSGTSTPLHKAAISNRHIHALRSEVIDGIEEILDEISQVDDQVGALAEVQIGPGDHILLHQPSTTAQRFVLRAAARRKFTVLIANSPPTRDSTGDEKPYAAFRKKLAAAGISLVNISSGAAMAYMSRVDKVIMGASAIVASGGIVTDAGASAIARAAKENGATVIVLAGIYKLSPANPFREGDVIEWANPMKYVNFGDGDLVQGVTVKAALKEYIPSDLIDTYITNLGTHSREHLGSLISDHYKHEDADLHLLELTGP